MKSYSLKMSFLLVCLFSCLYANSSSEAPITSLLTGVYVLEGSNPGSETINYHGKVEIRECGSNYRLTWSIGNSQVQTGIGILKDHILSVAYYDFSGNGGTGVVSFCLTDPQKLEGSWAGYGTPLFGKERLTFSHR